MKREEWQNFMVDMKEKDGQGQIRGIIGVDGRWNQI